MGKTQSLWKPVLLIPEVFGSHLLLREESHFASHFPFPCRQIEHLTQVQQCTVASVLLQDHLCQMHISQAHALLVSWVGALQNWGELATGVLLGNVLPDRCASLKCLLLLAHDSRWFWNPVMFSWFLKLSLVLLCSHCDQSFRITGCWLSGEWWCHKRYQELYLLLEGQ